jgi:hypothetical protein
MTRLALIAALALLAACNQGAEAPVSEGEQQIIDKANADVTAAMARATDDTEGRRPQ